MWKLTMLPSVMGCLTDKARRKCLVEDGNVVRQRHPPKFTLTMSRVGEPRYRLANDQGPVAAD